MWIKTTVHKFNRSGFYVKDCSILVLIKHVFDLGVDMNASFNSTLVAKGNPIKRLFLSFILKGACNFCLKLLKYDMTAICCYTFRLI